MGTGGWAKIAPQLFSKYLKDRICKIKYYLNYILIIISQNTLAILRTFSNPQNFFIENFTPKIQVLLLNFLAKFLTERKYLENNLAFLW